MLCHVYVKRWCFYCRIYFGLQKKNYFSDFPKHTFLPYTILLPHLCPIGCEYYMWIQLYALIHFECCISHKITWWTFFFSLSSECAEDKMMEMLKPFATQVENKDFSSLLFILLLGCSWMTSTKKFGPLLSKNFHTKYQRDKTEKFLDLMCQ